MKKLLYISAILCFLAPVKSADAITPFRQKAKQPSIEVNLIALRYLQEDSYIVQQPAISSTPIISSPQTRRAPQLQNATKSKPVAAKPKKVSKPKPIEQKKAPAKIKSPKIETPKIEQTKIPKPPKAPEAKAQLTPTAPALEIPPLPSFIREEVEAKPIPTPKQAKPQPSLAPPKAPAPIIEPPKFTPPPLPVPVPLPVPTLPEVRTNNITPAPVEEMKKVDIPTFEPPKFEPPTIPAPSLEIPAFVPPAIPEPPKMPEISADEETITVPELPSIEKEIAATQRTITLPPPIFSNDNIPPSRLTQPPAPSELPSMEQLFGEAPRPPVPLTATNDEPKSLIGKPALETVTITPQELPSLNNLPISAESPVISVPFTEAEVDFPISEQAKLLEIIANMRSNPNAIVKVVSFASGTPDQSSQAKRTALARALSVRKILKEREIESERIVIRPMGNKATSGVPDRVDIFLTEKEGA